jgi:hypothetical protein
VKTRKEKEMKLKRITLLAGIISILVSAAVVNAQPVYMPSYLILYANGYSGNTALAEFAKWKMQQGYEVTMWPVQPFDDVDDVKTMIENWYGSYPPGYHPPMYVLLVGDAPDLEKTNEYPGHPAYNYLSVRVGDMYHLPTYSHLEWGGNPPDPQAPLTSDYYYQLLEGNDDYPDIAIGRWCVENNTQLDTYVEKTFYYERNPNLDWDCNEALFVACRGEADYHEKCKDSIDTYIITPLNNDNVIDYDIVKAYGEQGAKNGDVEDEIQLYRGVGLVNYCGHGARSCEPDPPGYNGWQWWCDIDLDFTTTDVYALNQASFQGFPVVLQLSCWNGFICDPDRESMVEAWTRNPDGGGVAALGASHPSDKANYGNWFLDAYLFQYLFTNQLDCGLALKSAHTTILQSPPDPDKYGKYLNNARMYHWIGDPSLDVWRGPVENANMDLTFTIPGVEIEITYLSDNSPVVGATVCIYNENGGNGGHRITTTDANGEAFFARPFGNDDAFCHFTTTYQKGTRCIRPVTVTYDWRLYSSDIDEREVKATVEWKLEPISPNLVVSSAIISYSVAMSGSVDLSIFDATGREIKTLVSGEQSPGRYQITWDGCDAAGAQCPAGTYFVQMNSAGFKASERIVLVR